MTKRSFGLPEQHEAVAITTNLKTDNEGLVGQSRKVDPPLHIDQQRLEIEVFVRGLPDQPALSPGTEGAYERRQLLARLGQGVLWAVGSVGSNDCPNEKERLEPFRQDRAGYAGNATADVVEAPTATQHFSHNQESPPAPERFVGARHGAELPISRHIGNLAWAIQPMQSGIRTLRGFRRQAARSKECGAAAATGWPAAA